MTMPVVYLLIIIAWAVLFVGFFLQDYTIIMLSTIFILVLGVDIIINGLNSLNNFATQAFGIFHLGISFYVMLKANMEKIKK